MYVLCIQLNIGTKIKIKLSAAYTVQMKTRNVIKQDSLSPILSYLIMDNLTEKSRPLLGYKLGDTKSYMLR